MYECIDQSALLNITVWRYGVTSLQMDNRGNRLLVTDDSSAINTPAVSAGHVIKRYQAQAPDELTLQVRGQVFVCGCMLSWLFTCMQHFVMLCY